MDVLETIRREARSHRTVVIEGHELDGSRESREVEPYSLRDGPHGPRLMFWCLKRNAMRSLLVANLTAAAATGRPFQPRYTVEL